ncbi:hypothetical protein [Chromobacterium subtsugae]|uniref:hypothetical protein n=1 Tax=Chromobacterium subtsugae TaxID=251747 RepID=UPI00128BA2A0|nr:hypothetical protein [Chromobacterium subtsugae]
MGGKKNSSQQQGHFPLPACGKLPVCRKDQTYPQLASTQQPWLTTTFHHDQAIEFKRINILINRTEPSSTSFFNIKMGIQEKKRQGKTWLDSRQTTHWENRKKRLQGRGLENMARLVDHPSRRGNCSIACTYQRKVIHFPALY